MEVLGQELRNRVIKVGVNPILVVRTLVLEIIGESAYRRDFKAALGVQIGVTGSPIHSTVADSDIRQTPAIVAADGSIAGHVDHKVIHSAVPSEVGCGIEIHHAPNVVHALTSKTSTENC